MPNPITAYSTVNPSPSAGSKDVTGTLVGSKYGVDVNIIGGSGGGGGTTYPTDDILKATDLSESYTWADWNSRKLRRVTSITYVAPSVSATAQIVDTFSYTLLAGEYRLDDVVRVYTP